MFDFIECIFRDHLSQILTSSPPNAFLGLFSALHDGLNFHSQDIIGLSGLAVEHFGTFYSEQANTREKLLKEHQLLCEKLREQSEQKRLHQAAAFIDSNVAASASPSASLAFSLPSPALPPPPADSPEWIAVQQHVASSSSLFEQMLHSLLRLVMFETSHNYSFLLSRALFSLIIMVPRQVCFLCFVFFLFSSPMPSCSFIY